MKLYVIANCTILNINFELKVVRNETIHKYIVLRDKFTSLWNVEVDKLHFILTILTLNPVHIIHTVVT